MSKCITPKAPGLRYQKYTTKASVLRYQKYTTKAPVLRHQKNTTNTPFICISLPLRVNLPLGAKFAMGTHLLLGVKFAHVGKTPLLFGRGKYLPLGANLVNTFVIVQNTYMSCSFCLITFLFSSDIYKNTCFHLYL